MPCHPWKLLEAAASKWFASQPKKLEISAAVKDLQGLMEANILTSHALSLQAELNLPPVLRKTGQAQAAPELFSLRIGCLDRCSGSNKWHQGANQRLRNAALATLKHKVTLLVLGLDSDFTPAPFGHQPQGYLAPCSPLDFRHNLHSQPSRGRGGMQQLWQVVGGVNVTITLGRPVLPQVAILSQKGINCLQNFSICSKHLQVVHRRPLGSNSHGSVLQAVG